MAVVERTNAGARDATRAGTPSAGGDGGAVAPELRIVEWQNERIVRGAYPFDYQAPDEVLRELRERYRLDEVIALGRTELEQILRLQEWVHTHWKHGWHFDVPMRSALDILAAAQQGRDFACGYYATTLMQCLLAVGFVARLVSVSKAATEWMAAHEGNVGHAVLEVWSHQFHKWVLLDPDSNVHYEHQARPGVPLSALEVHRAWVTRRWDDVRLIPGPTPFRLTEDERSKAVTAFGSRDNQVAEFWTFGRHDVGDYYAHVTLPMRNTQHSRTDGAPPLEWVDAHTPPRLERYNQPIQTALSSNEADLYWTVDQVQIDLRAEAEAWQAGRAVLHVSLEHSMPNLAKLLVRLDDEPWRETPAGFEWSLQPGKNQIMAKGVNAFGREGHISRVLLRYHG